MSGWRSWDSLQSRAVLEPQVSVPADEAERCEGDGRFQPDRRRFATARAIAKTGDDEVSRRQRKTVERLFAHLKRILKPDRLRLQEPNGARDEFHPAATA